MCTSVHFVIFTHRGLLWQSEKAAAGCIFTYSYYFQWGIQTINSNCTESKNVFFGRVSFFGFEGKNETLLQSANSICVISPVLVQYFAAASVNDVI